MVIEVICAALAGMAAGFLASHIRKIRARRAQWLLPDELAIAPAIAPLAVPFVPEGRGYCVAGGRADSTCELRTLRFPEASAPASALAASVPAVSSSPVPIASRPGELVEPEQYDAAPPLPNPGTLANLKTAADPEVAADRDISVEVTLEELAHDSIDWDDEDEPSSSRSDSNGPLIEAGASSLTDEEWLQVAASIPAEPAGESAAGGDEGAAAANEVIDVEHALMAELPPDSLTPLPLSDLVADMCEHASANAADELPSSDAAPSFEPEVDPVSYVRELAATDEDDTLPFTHRDLRAVTPKADVQGASDSVPPPHMALPVPVRCSSVPPPSLPRRAMFPPPLISEPPLPCDDINEDDTRPNAASA